MYHTRKDQIVCTSFLWLAHLAISSLSNMALYVYIQRRHNLRRQHIFLFIILFIYYFIILFIIIFLLFIIRVYRPTPSLN